MLDATLGLVIAANALALIALAVGLLSTKATTLQKAMRTAATCAVIAAVGWMVLPVWQAAIVRSKMDNWSPEERRLVQETVRTMDVNPIYDVATLFQTIHFFVLPIVATLLLRYRWVRPRLRGE